MFEAVYRQEVEALVQLAQDLETESPPEALRCWLQAFVEFVATKKGMSAALAMNVTAASGLMAYSQDRLGTAAATLLRRGSKDFRPGITANDLILTVVGLCYVDHGPHWQETVLRLLDVFLAGMRTHSPPASPEPVEGRHATHNQTA